MHILAQDAMDGNARWCLLCGPRRDLDTSSSSLPAGASHTLASGGDDGVLRVWDLRTFGADRAANEASFVANFAYHRQAVQLTCWTALHPTLVSWDARP